MVVISKIDISSSNESEHSDEGLTVVNEHTIEETKSSGGANNRLNFNKKRN